MSLTQERFKELLHYDPETGAFTWLVGKGNVKAGDKAGCRSNGYLRVRIDRKDHLAHRLAWLYIYAVLPPDDIDHINGGRADNRVANLRLATQAQNRQNLRKAHRDSATGYLGVEQVKRGFRAQIMVRGVKHNLGLYPTVEDAHNIYLAFKRLMRPYGAI